MKEKHWSSKSQVYQEFLKFDLVLGGGERHREREMREIGFKI